MFYKNEISLKKFLMLKLAFLTFNFIFPTAWGNDEEKCVIENGRTKSNVKKIGYFLIDIMCFI